MTPQDEPVPASTAEAMAERDGFGAADAVRAAHAWFHHHSGWAPPDIDTLVEWVDDGVCRCPDECLVGPEEWCSHGLASWWLILRDEGGVADDSRPDRG